MIKTNIDKPAKPEVPLIILGVLKGYVDGAEDFMDKTMEKGKEIAKKILEENPKYPAEFVNIVSNYKGKYWERYGKCISALILYKFSIFFILWTGFLYIL